MSNTQNECPECRTPLEEVRLIDATERRFDGPMRHVDLSYAAPDARASFFIGRIPSLGTIRGMICPKCGRILMYGQPHLSE